MKAALSAANGRDLLIVFAIATAAGFAFVYLDTYVLNKVETAVGIPQGAMV